MRRCAEEDSVIRRLPLYYSPMQSAEKAHAQCCAHNYTIHIHALAQKRLDEFSMSGEVSPPCKAWCREPLLVLRRFSSIIW